MLKQIFIDIPTLDITCRSRKAIWNRVYHQNNNSIAFTEFLNSARVMNWTNMNRAMYRYSRMRVHKQSLEYYKLIYIYPPPSKRINTSLTPNIINDLQEKAPA